MYISVSLFEYVYYHHLCVIFEADFKLRLTRDGPISLYFALYIAICCFALPHVALRIYLYTLGQPNDSHSFKRLELKNPGKFDQAEHIAVSS